MDSTLEQFSFTHFKQVMAVADIDEPTYALILRSVFAHLRTFHNLDIDTRTAIEFDLMYAIYRHAKYIFETYKNNTDIINSVNDPAGNKTTFNRKIPKEISGVYKAYSPEPPAYL